MKLIILLGFIVAISAAPAADGPSQISSNNVGNVVNVDIEGSLKYNNQVNAVLVNFLLGVLNLQQLAVVAPADAQQINVEPTQQQQKIIHEEVPKIDPKILEKLKQALSQKHY